MNELLEPAAPDAVQLRLLYDVFSPSTVELHELVYQPGASLQSYFEGLPEECEWKVFHNGQEVALAHSALHIVKPGDQLGLILIPQGGDTFKSILRIALVAAVAVVGALTQTWWIIGLVAFGAGLINAFLLTPKQKVGNDSDTSNSYGIDGAKNSATENIPYPIVYGEYRVAGNFSDVYTENVGDDQYLYLRTVLNDGPADSISNIEINEQAIENFQFVETRFKNGTLTESVNDWFGRSIRQVNKSVKIDTSWIVHETSTPVNQVRFDVGFTSGLVKIDQKKGTYSNASVTFEMQCRLLDTTTKQPISDWFGAGAANASTHDGGGSGIVNTFTNVSTIKLDAKSKLTSAAADSSSAATAAGVVQYRLNGGAWITAQPTISQDNIGKGYSLDSSGDGSVAGDTDITPLTTQQYVIPVDPSQVVDLRVVNGTAENLVTFSAPGTSSITISDKRTRQIRRSFESGSLPYGFYQTRIRRTSTTSTDQYLLDEVYLNDVAEIVAEQVALRGTANLSLRIKLNEQLNGIPALTVLERGSILQEYDIEGNPTVKRWSNNVAWVALDILCGVERGAGTPSTEIDWPAWYDFAQHCIANNLAFNGVFEEGTTLGDAFQTVLRVGQAAPVPLGNKLSVVIDRKRSPVTAFGQGSIIKGTFQISYMSVADRANEYEVSYFDRNDRNKQKTIRYVDPKAVMFNETQRLSSISLMGVDNIEQARKELWRNIYANRLLIRTLEFETWLESINLVQGENALISHNMLEWSDSGRTAAGSSTTRVQLDQPVTMYDGKAYSILLHYDAVEAGRAVISNVVGKRIMVPTASFFTPGNIPARVTSGLGVDHQVMQVVKGANFDTILLDSTDGLGANGEVIFWYTDVLTERAVAAPQGDVTQSFVDLVEPLDVAPDALRNFIFGEVVLVKKEYTLTGISGNGVQQRKLTFVEYDERVYGPPEVEIPTPVATISDREVAHVQTLLFDYEKLVESDRKTINARVHWSAAGIRNYAGADIYMGLNGGSLRPVATALNMTEQLIALNDGDVPEFKVVAFNARGDRAPFATAPTVKGTVAVVYADLDPPRNVKSTITNYQVDGRAQISWTAPVDATGVTGYEVRYAKKAAAAWTSLGGNITDTSVAISGLETATYIAQVRSISSSSTSSWVETEFVVAVLPGSIMANFLSSNDRNPDPIPAPETKVDIDVDHVINKDGSADLSFEWDWSGDEATIDGFEVVLVTSDT